jgi:aldehyde:ferredoxin oxidoreductase
LFGWMGKILEVDLSSGKAGEFSSAPYAEKFLGGRGLASRLYWERARPGMAAFDPQNPLIFMTGPLGATGVQGATRLSIVGKSPSTLPEGYCFGNMGGFVGPEIKKAGYDGIVVVGRAAKAQYLRIADDKVELLDASALWGQGAYKTAEELKEKHGQKISFITTGVAGERLVRTAILFGSHQSTSCAGFGAVMGSKNLKAIVVEGSGKPEVAHPDELKELIRYSIEISRRVRLSIPPLITGSGRGQLLEVIGKGGCYQCGLECVRGYYRYGQKLEDFRRCQSMEYYLPWKYKLDNEPIETLFDAPTLANDYSIDTFELQSMIDWLYACQRTGVLTELETDLPLSKIGSREFLEKLLHSIAYREGFGDVLAQGMVRAAESVSSEARSLYGYAVAPIGLHDLAPPRAIVANALTYALEPRVHQPLIHEISFLMAAWNMNRAHPGSTPVTNRLFHQIARIFWGSEAAGDLSSYEGKALAAKKIQDHTLIKDSLGMCDYAVPLTYSFATSDNLGDPELEAKLYRAVTGRDGAELEVLAGRICDQQRLIQLREGRELPQADYPPGFNFSEPLKTNARGQPMLVPGAGDNIVDATGKILDRTKYDEMLKEYYSLRGWDEGGRPRPGRLAELGMEEDKF